MVLMVNEFIFNENKFIHRYFSLFKQENSSKSCILCTITTKDLMYLSGILTNFRHLAPSLVLLKALQFSKLKNKSSDKMVGGGGREIDFLGGN